MDANIYSTVHFFNTLRDTIVARPYAILQIDEVNSLVNRISNLTKSTNAQFVEYASDFLRAVANAREDGYFPVVILPSNKYETTLSLLI
jgi:hypothetical protein